MKKYGLLEVTDGLATPPGTDLGTKKRGGEGVLEGETIIGETAKPAQDTVYVPKDYLRQVEQDNAEWQRAWQRREWRENAAWALVFLVSLALLVVTWLTMWNGLH